MSQRFRVWRTDIEDEAVTVELESHDHWSAAREFAEREWLKEQDESMELELEDSLGNRFVAMVEVEMEPSFDVSVRKKPTPTT